MPFALVLHIHPYHLRFLYGLRGRTMNESELIGGIRVVVVKRRAVGTDLDIHV